MTDAGITDAALDQFRAQGDQLLDPLIAALPRAEVPRLLGVLFRTEGLPVDDPELSRLLQVVPVVPVQDRELLRKGQDLFQLYGPEILLVLGCYGLPAAYAAANGVEVIRRARRLQDDAKRRLCETAQMLINVMHPGALDEGAIGTRSCVKVRLMHALIRRHVQSDASAVWSAALGEPINQEDLAGTLLTFSVLVLDGLRKIGVQLSDDETLGYLEVWRHVATILGIDERLASRSVSAAEALAVKIGQRQFRASAAATALTRELVAVTNSLFPVPGYGLSLMHFFLDESVFGLNLATLLELPAANSSRVLVRLRAGQKRVLLKLLNRVPGARARRRAFAGFFTQNLILLQRPDKHSPFEIPPSVLANWRLRGSEAEG